MPASVKSLGSQKGSKPLKVVFLESTLGTKTTVVQT